MPPRPSGTPRPGSALEPWPEAPERLIGQTLAGRYRLERPIGSGGMGMVFLAEHVLIHKPVAIKVLSPEHSGKRAEVERFLGEARAASKIRHEHVVDITDFGSTDDGRVFLVMEYLAGEDLATTSEREGAIGWRRAAAMVLQIAAALEGAHAHGIVHRDMKPENCMRIRRGDDEDFIKVLDFGIAKIVDEKREAEMPTNSGSGLIGTPEYVAPELVRGLKGDARVDIYAVGVIFYRLLTGRVPFVHDTFLKTLTAHLNEMPAPPSQVVPASEIPPAVDEIVLRALAKDPNERFATIVEFSAALRAAVSEGAPVPVSEAGERGGIHPRVVLAVVVALIVSFAGVLAYVVQKLQAREPAVVAQAVPVAAEVPAVPTKLEVAAPEPDKTDAAPAPEAVPEDVAAPVAEPPAAPREPEHPRPAATEKKPRPGPEKLSAAEFRAGMAKVAPRVKLECSRFALRKMEVTVEVTVAADGRVKSAAPVGSQAGSTLGNCVARVVTTALFKETRTRSSHRHTFTM